MIIHAHTVRSTLASSVLLRPWFVVLVLAGAVERLFGLALGVAMERDWVVLVVLSNSFFLCIHLQIIFNFVVVYLDEFVCTVGRNKSACCSCSS